MIACLGRRDRPPCHLPHTSDKTSYAHRGLKKTLAEQKLAAIPDDVEVFYDPAEPETAYLSRHRPGRG
jgi:hypothetical protein